jgi:hypothetical protein
MPADIIESIAARRPFMTSLLERAFQEASKLPSIAQNSLAKWLLEELEDEKKWDLSFAESEDILDKLANEALTSDKNSETEPLDMNKL